MKSAVIALEGVHKSFGSREVLRQLDLTVPEHSVFAFLGNNGHGKSTTIRLITGLLRADRGDIRVLGRDIRTQRARILGELGCLVDSPTVYPNLNAAEFLSIGCTLKGLGRQEIDRVLDVVGLRCDRSLRIGHYSLGMKQRLALAHALLGRPRLLILDEPTNGLDPDGIQDVRRLLMALPAAADCTVFFSSHQLDEVEKTASHLALLRDGRIHFQASVLDLAAQQAGVLSLDVCDAVKGASLLEALGYPAKANGSNNILVANMLRQDASRVHESLIRAGINLYESVHRKPSLEQWFLQTTATVGEAA